MFPEPRPVTCHFSCATVTARETLLTFTAATQLRADLEELGSRGYKDN
jgi:hypothetical protein